MIINIHTPQNLTENSNAKFSLEDCRQMNVLGKEREIEEMGSFGGFGQLRMKEDWEESL